MFTRLLFLFLSPALHLACSGPVEEFWWDVCCTGCQLPVWRLHATGIRPLESRRKVGHQVSGIAMYSLSYDGTKVTYLISGIISSGSSTAKGG